MRFRGNYLGFNYSIEKKNEQEFKVWLKEKILRYVFNMYDVSEGTKTRKTKNSIELEILREILAGDYT